MAHLQLITLCLYAVLSLGSSVILGRVLYRNGEVFIANILKQRPDLVKPINNVLIIGFYLVNIAFVLLYLSVYNIEITTLSGATAFLFGKVGFVFTVLGVWHYFNIALILLLKQFIKNHISWQTRT